MIKLIRFEIYALAVIAAIVSGLCYAAYRGRALHRQSVLTEYNLVPMPTKPEPLALEHQITRWYLEREAQHKDEVAVISVPRPRPKYMRHHLAGAWIAPGTLSPGE